MPNTSTIAFALIVGFIVFITVRGELPAYLCVIGIWSNCQTGTGSNSQAGNSTLASLPVIGALGGALAGGSAGAVGAGESVTSTIEFAALA